MSTNHGNTQLQLNRWPLYFEPLDERTKVYRPITTGDRLDDLSCAAIRLFGRSARRAGKSLARAVKRIRRTRQWKESNQPT